MRYVVHRRFRETALCGYVNVPAGTVAEKRGDMLFCGGRAMCLADSENGHRYFARDDDGNGLRRGRLTRAIMDELAKPGAMRQKRWDKVWADPLCWPFKRADWEDRWLWNDAFFRADIGTLQHIAALVGAKGG